MANRLDPIAVPQTTPDSIHTLFGAFVNEGDLENLMNLYEETAALVDRDGLVVKGTFAIRKYLTGLLSIKPRITIQRLSSIDAGDVVVLISSWELTGAAADGSRVVDAGRTFDVIRRQHDGTWKVVIDNPWGGKPALSC